MVMSNNSTPSKNVDLHGLTVWKDLTAISFDMQQALDQNDTGRFLRLARKRGSLLTLLIQQGTTPATPTECLQSLAAENSRWIRNLQSRMIELRMELDRIPSLRGTTSRLIKAYSDNTRVCRFRKDG